MWVMVTGISANQYCVSYYCVCAGEIIFQIKVKSTFVKHQQKG